MFSISIIICYCCGFVLLSSLRARLFFATGMVLLEVVVMWVLNSRFKTPGDSATFIAIYASAFLALVVATCGMCVCYSVSPWIMIILVLGEIFGFLLSIIGVTIQRSNALYKKFIVGI